MFKLDFKSKEEKFHKGFHHLSGVYLKEEDSINFEGETLFCFSIIYPKKLRSYYCDNKEDFYNWIEVLKKATHYSNLTDQYDVMNTIGNGKFGLVKLGKHKNTGRDVAIKIMKKDDMSELDLHLVKQEFEIMKICQHPNIIKIFDYYENEKYIYIS